EQKCKFIPLGNNLPVSALSPLLRTRLSPDVDDAAANLSSLIGFITVFRRSPHWVLRQAQRTRRLRDTAPRHRQWQNFSRVKVHTVILPILRLRSKNWRRKRIYPKR